MTMTTLEDLLLSQIQDIYDAEKQLVKALPKMAKAASSEELKEAIESHLEETKGQVARLEEIFTHLEAPAKSKPCKAMKGLIEEGSEAAGEKGADALVDLSVIAAAQRVEHYEISAYGTARAIAEHLGLDHVVALLLETEDEEKAADAKMTEIAQGLYAEVEETADEETKSKKPVAEAKAPARRAHRA